MERREFLGATLAGGLLIPRQGEPSMSGDVVIERLRSGKPHSGKVLAVIVSHADDAETGTVAKLVDEGYTAYLIRTSNDEMDAYGKSPGETVHANEQETENLGRLLGIRRVFHLGYRNHFMDDVPRTELRARLIFLFRLLKVDTVMTWDPWGHYEENPDHWVTGQAVEAACWMAGRSLDYPEHFAAGLEPHTVSERYYWARGPQLVNRVVDISDYIEKKMEAYACCRTMMLHMIGRLRDELASRRLRLPLLDGADDEVIRNFVRERWRPQDAEVGKAYGLDYAERFHYIGPDASMEDYVRRTAVPL